MILLYSVQYGVRSTSMEISGKPLPFQRWTLTTKRFGNLPGSTCVPPKRHWDQSWTKPTWWTHYVSWARAVVVYIVGLFDNLGLDRGVVAEETHLESADWIQHASRGGGGGFPFVSLNSVRWIEMGKICFPFLFPLCKLIKYRKSLQLVTVLKQQFVIQYGN
jgi:hypothetical protein